MKAIPLIKRTALIRFGFFVYFFIQNFGVGLLYAAPDRQKVIVEEVLTGDSVRLRGGKILKYAGLQAPPLQHLLPEMRQYGENAKKFNSDLISGKALWVAWGPQMRDDRGNLIGYVFLDDKTLVNLEIIKSGNAKVVLRPPNLAYASEFRRAELNARRDKLGLWEKEVENPFLKSEILGEKNTKIYYLPTSPELERIPKANLVPFRSKVEAKAAGYKPCSTCKEYSQQELY